VQKEHKNVKENIYSSRTLLHKEIKITASVLYVGIKNSRTVKWL
jgi:hypothetical protein